jgi:hypothetical protein
MSSLNALRGMDYICGIAPLGDEVVRRGRYQDKLIRQYIPLHLLVCLENLACRWSLDVHGDGCGMFDGLSTDSAAVRADRPHSSPVPGPPALSRPA